MDKLKIEDHLNNVLVAVQQAKGTWEELSAIRHSFGVIRDKLINKEPEQKEEK